MTVHSSHDWGETHHCVACGCWFHGIVAQAKCRPSTADSGLPSDSEPRAPIDYSKITEGFA